MDIYKLSDSVPEEKKATKRIRTKVATDFKQGQNDLRGQMIVTDLKQGLKNPNRVNVFIDGKFSFSLDVAQVVDYKLKKGVAISVEKLQELKSASEFGKLYQRTLEWVLMRPRSVKETRDYVVGKFRKSSSDALVPARRYGRDFARPLLVSRGWSSEDFSELSNRIITRLLDKGYLDDQKFAEYYVENRFVKKGVSGKRLKMELMKKGISNEIIDEVLNGRNDEEELDRMIARKRAKYDDEKLIQYLCRQGFSYELVKEKIHYSETD